MNKPSAGAGWQGSRGEDTHYPPWVVSRTLSALLGRPNHEGVWASGSNSTHCTNSSRLRKQDIWNQSWAHGGSKYSLTLPKHGVSPTSSRT